MIYGLNFNGSEIPPGIRKKFARYKKLSGLPRGVYAVLQGVGQSPSERNAMLLAATNGSRRLHVEERVTAAGVWYGIYVY